MLSQDNINNWIECKVAKLRQPKRIKTTDYQLKHRLTIQGMRTHKQLMSDTIAKSTKIGLIVLLTLATVTLVYRQHSIEKQQKMTLKAQSRLNQIEQSVISCLNHGALYIGGELYTCKMVNTRIKKETKHLDELS